MRRIVFVEAGEMVGFEKGTAKVDLALDMDMVPGCY